MNDFIKFRFDVSDISYWYIKENGTLLQKSAEVPYRDVSLE